MSRRRMIEIDGLEEWQQGLVRMGGPGMERLKDRVLRTAGLRAQEYLDDLTPVQSGRLKGSMTMGGADNVFDLQVGSQSYVVVGTNVEYATYVNDGFTQEAGRFVPGFWSSGTFHYVPNYGSGMVLKGKIIPGAKMFEKTMDYLEDDVPQILEFEFRRLYNELF